LTKKYSHHPIIEAKYADVVLRLSTWDAGHRITGFDARFAADLDKLASKWPMRSENG
jgi:pterin-4a-carbinolamine dehydratase